MSVRRRVFIIGYVLALFAAGFVLIFVTANAKLDRLTAEVRNPDLSLDRRLGALHGLATQQDAQALEVILWCLRGSDPFLKMRASLYAGERREYKAIPLLIQNLKDQTMLLHDRSGSMLPQVQICAYQALKRITGKDFGAVEGSPAEIAATCRKWEAWWALNAERYGMKVEEGLPDFNTAVLDPALPGPKRFNLLIEAERREYPGVPDIVVELIDREPAASRLLHRAIQLAARHKLRAAIPGLIRLLNDETLLPYSSSQPIELPLPAMWANEALVRITGQDFGTIYRHMSAEERKALVDQWQAYIRSKPETAPKAGRTAGEQSPQS
ncbi:MAG: hypothetical protein ABIF71_15810 [Planctomycetota bacterium]